MKRCMKILLMGCSVGRWEGMKQSLAEALHGCAAECRDGRELQSLLLLSSSLAGPLRLVVTSAVSGK